MDYLKAGQDIRWKRILMRMTQEELAYRAEISTAFVGHIERGTRKMSLDTMTKLCRVLELSADDLLGLKEA